MQNIPGLRSCYDKVGRLIYFGRMLDKIRLHAAGQLPPDYAENLGEHQFTLDGRCCRFLGVPYSEIKERTLAGEPDEAVLNWAHAHGASRTDEECNVWNRFIAKLGWRDERSHVLPQRIQESGLTGKPIETLIDHIEFDEGRDPVASTGLGKDLKATRALAGRIVSRVSAAEHMANYRAARALMGKGNSERVRERGSAKSRAKKSAVKNGAKGMSDMAG